MKVRRRIEAARGWEAERDREALPDRLEEIQEAGLGGLPSGVWRPIQDHLAPKDQARLAAVSGYINNALGGGEGARLRKEQHDRQNAPESWGEWHKRRRQERKQVDRNRRAAYKTRQCAAIVDLVLHRGEHMVGYKSISRKYRITQPSLRRLEERLFEDDFFSQVGWEFHVMDSGLLTGSDTETSSDGD